MTFGIYQLNRVIKLEKCLKCNKNNFTSAHCTIQFISYGAYIGVAIHDYAVYLYRKE